MAPPVGDPAVRGRLSGRLVVANRTGTVVFCAVTGAAAAWPEGLGRLGQIVALVLFASGCGAFLQAYLVALRRSRHEQVSTVTAFLGMPGAAPALRAEFRIALVLQFGAGLAGAAVRPFTVLAFGILAGVYGLGLMSLWGAACGSFARRSEFPERRHHG